MVQTTSQFDYLAALYTALVTAAAVTDSALEDVQISSSPIDPDKATADEWIELGSTTMDEEFASLGNNRQREEYTLDGRIVVTMAGSGQEQADALRDRAAEIFGALEVILRQNVHLAGVNWNRLDRVSLVQSYTASKLVMLVPFTLRVRADLNYS